MEVTAASRLLPVDDVTQVGAARRAVADLNAAAGWTEHDASRAALIVTEAATNLLKHAGNGRLIVRHRASGHIEILALDRGPGIARLDRCLRDGHSTAGSPGTGLGAISRAADFFDIYSQPGVGTALLARLRRARGPATNTDDDLDPGAVCVPKAGETACGDAWAIRPVLRGHQLLVADGLGHGPLAAAAAAAAVRIFLAGSQGSPAPILETVHAGLRQTRGVAAGIAEIDAARHSVTYAGVGNVTASIVDSNATHTLVSHNGTLGHEARRFQEFSYPFAPDALLIVHSDGVRHHWRLSEYPGLMERDPSLIAGVLYRDFARDRDDATVIVLPGGRRSSSVQS